MWADFGIHRPFWMPNENFSVYKPKNDVLVHYTQTESHTYIAYEIMKELREEGKEHRI